MEKRTVSPCGRMNEKRKAWGRDKGAGRNLGKTGENYGKKSGGRRAKLFLLLMILLAALVYSGNQLLAGGILSWHLNQKEYHSMAVEILILFFLFAFLYGIVRKRIWRGAGTLVILSVFLWAHGVFLPVAVSGIYIIYLTSAGCFFNRLISGTQARFGQKDGCPVYRLLIGGFLSGCLLMILVFCLMSAVGIGAIGYLKLFVAVSGCFLLIFGTVGRKKTGPWRGGKALVGEDMCSRGRFSWPTALCFAFMAVMLCIQAGRMNTALDFDSLWYGVRPQFILDNGHGIYENLGTIGVVYTYSKGWEVLTLPLAKLPSYSFLISFNLWLAVLVLFVSYRIARFYMEKGYALFFTAVLSCLPGIMNMAITTKTDMATLLFQEIMIYYFLQYLKDGRFHWNNLALSGASFFMTWMLKPTALVFSSAIFAMSLLFLILKRHLPWGAGPGIKEKRRPPESQRAGATVLLVSLCALSGIWARTMLITGLPVTSVFSSALTKLGLNLKYPFQVSGLPNSGSSLPLKERLTGFGKRLFHFLLRPVGADMDHVILAWGGFLLFALLVVWIFCLFSKKRADNESERRLSSWLFVVFLPFLVVCTISLFLLVQVDGNYFMLLYVLTALVVFCEAARLTDRKMKRGVGLALIPVMCFGALMASLTNWSWAVGFSPISFRHPGYYDHGKAEHQRLADTGNGQIWDILAENPGNRLIAVGDHPDVLAFPCSVQSYDDITGIWGNVLLVKTMDYFVDFMEYAKTDYVYAQEGYMGTDERCYSLVRNLIEYGKLVPVCYEEGNLLARVNTGGEYSDRSRNAAEEFDRCYEIKE